MFASALAGAGCLAPIHPPEEALQALLAPVETSPESVTLEIFHARIPLDQQEQADQLWAAIDEMRLSVDVRGRLTANGFRQGVHSGGLPADLAQLLQLSDEPAADEGAHLITDRSAHPRVTRRVVQLRRGDRTQIEASELADELHVLYKNDQGLEGSSFMQAQPVYQLRAAATAGQRVTVELLPELHHGELRNRYVGSDPGIFLMTPSREREVYADLRAEFDLAPGELLVLGNLEQAPGSIGEAFHTSRSTGASQRKLLLIRILQIPPSEILAE